MGLSMWVENHLAGPVGGGDVTVKQLQVSIVLPLRSLHHLRSDNNNYVLYLVDGQALCFDVTRNVCWMEIELGRIILLIAKGEGCFKFLTINSIFRRGVSFEIQYLD